MSRRLLHCTIGVVLGVLASGLLVAPVVAADPPELRYGFEADRTYHYDIEVQGELTDRKGESTGVLTYRVKQASDTQFVLEPEGVLSRTWETLTEDLVAGRMPRPRGFHSIVRGQGNTTFSRTGAMISTRSDTHLPFVLGLQDLLVIEPLPEKPQARWTTEMDVAVVERMSVGPFFSRFRSFSRETQTIAKERVEYEVVGEKDGVVRIRKTYSMKTLPDEGIVRFDMSGGGEFEFDTKEGVVRSQMAKYKIQVNEKNLTMTIPVSVRYRLLSDAEKAEWERKREEEALAKADARQKALADREAAVQKLQGRPAPGELTPLQPGEREKLIAELRSGNSHRIWTAAQRLARAIPNDEPVEEVGRALLAVLKGQNTLHQRDIIQAINVWTVPEAEQVMIDMVRSRDAAFLGSLAMAVLAKFRTPAAAQAAADSMTSNHTRKAAAEALRAMGPVAEDATIPLIASSSSFVRSEALEVLAAIGGEKSLRILKEQAWETRGALGGRGPRGDRQLVEAIEAIERRGGRPPDMPGPASSPGPASDAVMRTWHDATRSFQIEAQLLKFEDDQVTLRRQDGRVITLPLAKLCEEDREFVKQQATAVNPFD